MLVASLVAAPGLLAQEEAPDVSTEAVEQAETPIPPELDPLESPEATGVTLLDLNPLAPPRTGSPREALQSFTRAAFGLVRYWLRYGDASPDYLTQRKRLARYAYRTLDLSQVAPAQADDTAEQTTLFLAGVLARVDIPAWDEIPGPQEVVTGEIDRWTIPETPDSLPGTTYWVRDDDGNPTGVAIEFQWLDTHIGLGLWEPESMIRESILRLMGEAATYGTTALFSPGMLTPNLTNLDGQLDDYEAAMKAIEELIAEGKMPLRSFSMPTYKTKDSTPERLVPFALRMKAEYDSDMHGVTGIKIHPESGILNYGAPLIEPYAGKDTRGGFGVSPERTMELVMAANEAGLDVAIHVEGDASTRAAIDAFEASLEAGHTDVRNSLHHYMLVHPDDHQRVIDLGLLVNATPNFTNTFGDQNLGYETVLGQDRLYAEMGRYTDLANAGVRISIGSDYPGTPIAMQAPLLNIYAAMTNKDPSNPDAIAYAPTRSTMSLEQGLRAYTIDGALFMHMEDKIGSLEVGKLADIVVVAEDIRKVPVEGLKDVDVLGTMLDGRFTHRDGI